MESSFSPPQRNAGAGTAAVCDGNSVTVDSLTAGGVSESPVDAGVNPSSIWTCGSGALAGVASAATATAGDAALAVSTGRGCFRSVPVASGSGVARAVIGTGNW